MKKLFTIATLIVVAAFWTTADARWVVGARKSASEIKAGDTVVINYAASEAYSDYYLQAADDDHKDLGVMVAQGMGLGAAAIITLEEGPEDLRTGEPTFLLKLVASDKYIGNNYYDWYNIGQGAVSTPDKAANFQILSCGEEIPWYDETRSDDFTKWTRASDAVWDEKSVGFSASPSSSDFCYLAFWNYASSSPRAITWKYTNSIEWNVYDVTYEKDYRDDLEALINSYSTASSDFVGGSNPGFYDEQVIEAYNSVLENAMLVCYTPSSTDDELLKAINDLKEAYRKMSQSLIPVTEGYYYIINDNYKIADAGASEKAMFINGDTKKVYWGAFNPEDIKFVFYLSAHDANTWDVKNLKNDLYLSAPEGFCKPFAASDANDFPSTFKFYPGTGSCYIKTNNWTMCPQGNAGGTNEGPNYVWAYNGETTSGGNVPHAEWTWTLRKVTDQGLLDRIFAEKEQSDRTAELSALSKEGADLYDNRFSYKVDTDNGRITDADKQLVFSHIRVQGVDFADKPSFLTDGCDTTFVQGEGYIQIDISDKPSQVVSFFYKRRGATVKYPSASTWGEQERPAKVTVYAANDTVNGGDWTLVKDLNMADLEDPIIASLDLGATYKFIRYTVNTNKSGGSYYTMSEFQLYPAVVDEATSQYFTAEGMKPVADVLKEKLATVRSIIEANTATATDIADLRSAISAVKSLYADTTELTAVIADCENLVAKTTVGDAIGQVDDEARKTALAEAVEVAKRDGLKTDISKAELDAVLAALVAARADFLAHVKSFEAGKWYFIVNNDATAESTTTNKAIYMTGTSSTNAVGIGLLNEDGSPAYTYDPYAMWTFVDNGDGTFKVQNMGTGFYLGDFVKSGEKLLQSYSGVSYKVDFIGSGSYSLVPQSTANKNQYSLTASENNVLFDNAVAQTASSWQIIEIDPEATEVISIKDFGRNVMDIIALPFNIDNISDLNDDTHIYGIKKITQDSEGNSTIEFYEKQSAAAGESCWIVVGDPEAETEDNELLLPFPTSVTDKATPQNGLYGMLHSENIGEGDVYSSGKGLVCASGDVTISGHTGAIIPEFYKGEVAGVETAFTLSVKGMRPIGKPSDVNGDGEVNSSDVVALYNYIQVGASSGLDESVADVNGDGRVDASDVVYVYNVIAGSGASSHAFYPWVKRLMGE